MTTNQLIASGNIVPVKVVCAEEIDMTGAALNSMGEWSDNDVEQRAIPICGDIVSEWEKYVKKYFGAVVKTLVFSATVKHGEELVKEFRAAGYDFEQVSYRDKYQDGKRSDSIQRFREGKLLGLISCEALAKGFDVPDALCLVSARPYRKSVASHIQQLGRIMRAYPGKEYGLVLDHAGNYLRHADAVEEFWLRGWNTLDDGKVKDFKAVKKERKERKCFRCNVVMPANTDICPDCGAKRPSRRNFQIVPGKMREYQPHDIAAKFSPSEIWRNVSRLGINRHPEDMERARKFANMQYLQLTGRWQRKSIDLMPVDTCSPEIAAEVERSLRKWIRRKKRENKKSSTMVSA